MSRPKKKAAPRVAWKFDDGSTGSIPLADHEAQLQAQYHAMANSDDPSLRVAGRRLAREAAEQAAAKQWADLQAASNATRPRSKSPIKERIQAVMRPYKADGTDFKTFLESWERDAIDGLLLSDSGDLFLVYDEDGDGQARYTFRSLQKLYSTCL